MTNDPEEVDFADAMARYSQSCDDVRTLRLNPLKATPFEQRPEETQIRGGAIFHRRDPKSYVRYLLRIAAENERTAMQARTWWAWWERAQVEPLKAGPAPLVSSRIEAALRMAATRRGAEFSIRDSRIALRQESDEARAVHPSGGPSNGSAPPAVKPAGSALSDEPAATPAGTLKFARPLTAAQACLDALTNAKHGIPTHEDIAKATGYAVATIKEAMPPLAKAGHVEKLDGAWRITGKGREHRKALRGE